MINVLFWRRHASLSQDFQNEFLALQMTNVWRNCVLLRKRQSSSSLENMNEKLEKILLVVNSYAQSQEVQQTLEAALRKANCSAHVCRMISDAISSRL